MYRFVVIWIFWIFVQVCLVQKLDTGHVYAMKVLRKSELLAKEQACALD